jgi:hypothetical protein
MIPPVVVIRYQQNYNNILMQMTQLSPGYILRLQRRESIGGAVIAITS